MRRLPSLTFSLIAATAYARHSGYMENLGHWIFDQTLYDGTAGVVDFNCGREWADGVVRCRGVDEYGIPTVTEVTFRISNRWPLTGRRRPGGLVVLGIHSQAQLAGLRPINLQWFTPTAQRITQSVIDLRAIEGNQRLARSTARRGRFHRQLARWFPAPEPKGFDANDHADMIIKRV